MTSPGAPRLSPDSRPVAAAAVGHAVVAGLLLTLATIRTDFATRGFVIVVLAMGMCWGSNTYSHIHLHNPLFENRIWNRLFSVFLSVTLGIPQTWWKQRHLVHHGATDERDAFQSRIEIGILIGVGILSARFGLSVFASVYLPAWVLGLGLCALQGHYEHAAAPATAGVDFHGCLYNRLWFNDGYHAAHHHNPRARWTTMRDAKIPSAVVSTWPPTLRWMDAVTRSVSAVLATILDLLERATRDVKPVRRFLLSTHRRAIQELLSASPRPIRRACIVGGGLFPRTALVLRSLWPNLPLVIVDAKGRHLDGARHIPQTAPTTFIEAHFDPRQLDPMLQSEIIRCDLLIVPLAYRGDRDRLYTHPPAPLVIIHDWFWRRRTPCGGMVSPWLLKRVNLIHGPRANEANPSVTIDHQEPCPRPPTILNPPPSLIFNAAKGKPS